MHAAGKRYIKHGSRSDEFTLWVLGDLHVGAGACVEHMIARDVQRIKDDPHAFWVGIGDNCDHIGPKDKRWDAGALADWITVQDLGNLGMVCTKRVLDLLMPIKDKCLGMLYGNHEASYMKQNEQSKLHSWLCAELDAPDLGYCALFDLCFIRAKTKVPILMDKSTHDGATAKFRIFAHHGAGSSATPGGKLNRLIKFMQDFQADIYMMGHVHDQKGQRRITIGADATCTKIVQKETIGVITGSYLRCYPEGHTTYGEIKGYSPAALGAVKIYIKPESRELRAEV